jgi:hypothetical protein
MSQIKTRADAKLKTLPKQRQAEIAELLGTRTLEKARAALSKQGLDVSLDTLSRFYSWWQSQQPSSNVQRWTEILERMDSGAMEREVQIRAAVAILQDSGLPTDKVVSCLRRIFGIK